MKRTLVCRVNVVGVPVAQPRMTQRNKWKFKDHPIHAWRNMVAHRVNRIVYGNDKFPCKSAFEANLTFRFIRPKCHYGTGRNAERVKPSAPIVWEHLVVPDRDNLEKAVLDSLSGIVWHDDSQVVTGTTTKRYTEQGEEPGASIEIYRLEEA